MCRLVPVTSEGLYMQGKYHYIFTRGGGRERRMRQCILEDSAVVNPAPARLRPKRTRAIAGCINSGRGEPQSPTRQRAWPPGHTVHSAGSESDTDQAT